ncbi:VWA domain containing CoxE-like protein [Saccharomonospora marina XMU15]|uniref:VWA domain containing CoxE-like protein n=1 Tax=Saccharomonospora marina XMU15 TaxID=882083 RepID=H5X630_9PSEU|nr:VWA domain-containing protein [Saccharomonospora marina]EHR53429.1 VWA domain containing CoxE-like protein [Saccharomonospora marina XMU15]
MSTHVAAPTAAPTAMFPAAPGWLTLSAAFGDEAPAIADRDDLVVTVAPGAGHGAPACFFPDLATIEVDGAHLDSGVDPATVAPHRVGDRKRYRTAWGLLTHECAHAKHSVWRTPDNAPPGAAAAAELLEESRIEAAHLRRRPGDRYWLRASATNLILADMQANNPATAPKMTTHDAARSAALLLARVDGGVLNRRETAVVTRVVTQILDADTLDTLREIWREAHRTADDNADAMIDLGRRWCEALGTDPNQPPPKPGIPGNGQSTNGTPSPLAQAVASAARAVSRAVATDPAPTDPVTQALEAAADENEARQDAHRNARAVFNRSGKPPAFGTTTRGTRAPRTSERTAARQLARALNTAGVRDRTVAKTRSATPPGRLRMRGAMTADAQRAAGTVPTAEPFTRTTRATVPAPPLRIGIACDVSGSMSAFAKPVASAAWILADAAHHTAVPTTTASVIFGYHVRPITHPGNAPPRVTEFDAGDGEHRIDTAISALDGALDLSRPDAARLLVIISDGCFESITKTPAQKMLDRLRANGCAVLWLQPDEPSNEPMDGATVHTLTDPTTTARAIGQAATAALRATR